MFNGKCRAQWPFSIAMLNYQTIHVVLGYTSSGDELRQHLPKDMVTNNHGNTDEINTSTWPPFSSLEHSLKTHEIAMVLLLSTVALHKLSDPTG